MKNRKKRKTLQIIEKHEETVADQTAPVSNVEKMDNSQDSDFEENKDFDEDKNENSTELNLVVPEKEIEQIQSEIKEPSTEVKQMDETVSKLRAENTNLLVENDNLMMKNSELQFEISRLQYELNCALEKISSMDSKKRLENEPKIIYNNPISTNRTNSKTIPYISRNGYESWN